MFKREVLWLICLLLFNPHCLASWWLLATPSAYQFTLKFNSDYKDKCRQMHYLVARQRELCQLSKNLLAIVSQGAQMGLKECQSQFAGRQWNCSTFFDSSVPNLLVTNQFDVGMMNGNRTKLSKLRKSLDGMMSDAPAIHASQDVGDLFGGILKLHDILRSKCDENQLRANVLQFGSGGVGRRGFAMHAHLQAKLDQLGTLHSEIPFAMQNLQCTVVNEEATWPSVLLVTLDGCSSVGRKEIADCMVKTIEIFNNTLAAQFKPLLFPSVGVRRRQLINQKQSLAAEQEICILNRLCCSYSLLIQVEEHKLSNLAANHATFLYKSKCPNYSREKAYIHAISAAGVSYSITRACSQGDLPSCSCDKNVHRRNFKNKRFQGQWEWGGCSEDVAYGERLSKDFVDSNELARAWSDPAPKLMNLHNNEAGRRAIRANMKLMCKCHGVSGSCTVKLCWRRMTDFQTIGEALSKKFDGAVKVKFSGLRHKLKPYVAGHKKPTKRDLVYLQQSPDFCQENPKLGVYGTKGRQCEKDGYSTSGCAILCCGRGYTVKSVEKVQDCNCKFQWCCEVKCEKCKHVVEEYFCK
ncbi:Protein Wnt-4 [Trichinella britovi]|uniref:Protein Wnt n=1 Tax=Trichinella britovi TaxID=45882 RepID=A0A0V1CAR7_TRIBR|nr:Protein Wnt-4 [Trichinella britovi]